MNNSWRNLEDKEIISILNGDTEIERIKIGNRIISLNMPPLSARDIIFKIGNHFGYYIAYYNDNKQARSRHSLFCSLFNNAIKENKMSEVLKYIFSKPHLRAYIENDLNLEVGYCKELIPLIQKAALKKINEILYIKDSILTENMALLPLQNKNMSRISTSHSLNLDDTNKKQGFYILPFEKGPEDVMVAIQHEINRQGLNLELVKAGDIFDDTFGSNILKEIENRIKNADVIIADISGKNPNVYYELGLATALNKHVLTICSKESFNKKEEYNGRLPLDISVKREEFYGMGYQEELEIARIITKKIQSVLENHPVRMQG